MPSISKEHAETLKKRASIIAITVAISLCSLKVFGSVYTGSLSILSSMVDSLSDIIGSLVTLIAVKFSCRPASEKFRYGYGKAEPLSALFQAAFIAGSGCFILFDGVGRFFNPRPIEQTTIGIAIMVFSVIVTLFLIAYQRYVFKKTQSQAILADSAHYVIDILTNSSIILTLVVVKFFDTIWFDTLMAVLIAFYLLYNAYDLAKSAASMLLDSELDPKIRNKVKRIVLDNDFVKGFHDLRTRDIGGVYTFEFHLELDGNINLTQAHDYAHEVEAKLLNTFPDSQVIIHQEPAGIEDERLDNKIVRRKRKRS
jgi:ferrous-iron efflux pump FieF